MHVKDGLMKNAREQIEVCIIFVINVNLTLNEFKVHQLKFCKFVYLFFILWIQGSTCKVWSDKECSGTNRGLYYLS